MKNIAEYINDLPTALYPTETESGSRSETEKSVQAFTELEKKVGWVLETYSNVHRGSGHHSMITTAFYEHARDIITEYLAVDKRKYTVIFSSVHGAELLKSQLQLLKRDFTMLSSADIGLPIGIRAIALLKKALPKGVPLQTGGSTARMVSPNYIIWSGAPQRFEPGTPMVVNAIAFAIALGMTRKYGKNCFRPHTATNISAEEFLEKDELSRYSGFTLLEELKKSLTGRQLNVPTFSGHVPFINFDHAASTPALYPVWETVKNTWRGQAELHPRLIQSTKKIISAFLGADESYDVLFTCNTTEAVNIAARLVKVRYRDDTLPVILNTSLEHNANELPWRFIPGVTLKRLPVGKEGLVDLSKLEEILRQHNSGNSQNRIRLVAVTGASNVLGTLNDIAAISRIAHQYGAPVLVDGAQMVAHHKVELRKWGIDYFVFSGHKVYAPFGSGALVVRKELVNPNRQEFNKYKAEGEENVIGIAAVGKAINLLQRAGIEVIEAHERILVQRTLKGLSGIKGLRIYGISDPDSPGIKNKGSIIAFSFRNGKHQIYAGKLAEQGAIGLRFGCFCSHMLVKDLLDVKPALALFQNVIITVAPRISEIVPGLMRVSFGLENEVKEIDRFISLLERITDPESHPAESSRAFTGKQDTKAQYRKELKQFVESRMTMVYGSRVQ